MTDRPRLTLRLAEVAEQTGVGLSTAQRWVASGLLPYSQPGGPRGVVLVRPADLEAFLDRHREGGGAAPASARATRRRA